MSFLKSLFGGGRDKPDAASAENGREDYQGFTITALTMKSGSEYQLKGAIEKQVGETVRRVEFIRADKFASLEDATAVTLRKGRQIIDEQGERVFL